MTGFLRPRPTILPYTYVLTAAADYLPAAIDEVRRLDPQLHQILEPDPEIAIVESALDFETLSDTLQHDEPIFLRHIVPAQSRVILSGEGNDLGALAREVVSLPEIPALSAENTFSVQARVFPAPGMERPYSPYAIKAAVAPIVQAETGAQEDVRDPQVVISILTLPTVGFVGISAASDNLSNWAGGARRFAREEGQLTRSEFKLLEALEVFDATPPLGGQALDLGAAPGGWTRVLHNIGMTVTAVDPAPLDPSVANQPGVQAVQGYAQEWVRSAHNAGRKFDVVVNDARMDARDAARFMVDVAPLMHLDSFAILTLKLPSPDAAGMDPIRITREAIAELRSRYRTVRARQLFHNRNEVTAFLRL